MPINSRMSSESQITQDQVVELVAGALGVSAARLNGESKAGDLVEWDSMGIVGLLTALNRDGIRFPPNDVHALQSMQGILGIFREAGRLA
jgi:hypothetical protein